MWELLTGEEPYADLHYGAIIGITNLVSGTTHHPFYVVSFLISMECINYSSSFKIGGIVNNTLRPPVPETCDPEWRSLMERCWSSDPSERPSFTEVVNRLRAMATALAQKAQLAQAQAQK